LETLNSKVLNQEKVCAWIGKEKPDDSLTVETIFYKIEALRLFGCQDGDLQAATKLNAQSLLLSPKGQVMSLNDYFFTSILNHNS